MLRLLRPLATRFVPKNIPKTRTIPLLRQIANAPFKFDVSMRRMHSFAVKTPEVKSQQEQDKESLKKLFQFISKNKKIPEFLATINPRDPKLHQLKTAIKMGNEKDAIFDDENCYLYLLYLMHENQISFSHGITTYIYLMCLMQSRLTIGEEKSNPVEVQKLVEDSQLTEAGEDYLSALCENFKMYNVNLNIADLRQFVLALPPCEQWLLKMPNESGNPNSIKSQSFTLMIMILKVVPFLYQSYRLTQYWIPSISLINYLLQKLSPKPIKICPIFGTISEKTLQQMHSNGEHPLPLYAPAVFSNPSIVHSFRAWPVPILLHDFVHIILGSLISPENRELLYKRFIPFLLKIKDQAKQHHDKELMDLIDKIIINTNDFNYVGTYFFEIALFNFKDQFYPKKFIVETLPIGECVEDRFLYLINEFVHREGLLRNEKAWWLDLVASANFSAINRSQDRSTHRPHDIVHAIIFTGKQTTRKFDSTNRHDDIDWKKWLKLIESSTDSFKLWSLAKKHQNELVLLMKDHNLKFFHPYSPMTEEYRQEFIQFLRAKLVEQQKEVSMERSFRFG